MFRELGYVVIEGVLTDVYDVLEKIARELGSTEDIEDTLRILRNFDAHYSSLRKKFKEYITPRKSERDLLLGKVIVDKIKLRVENNQKIVTVVFDKRVNQEYILKLMS
ncbi:MAG: hypothetical protein QW036_03535 [Zestosphaera sp.]